MVKKQIFWIFIGLTLIFIQQSTGQRHSINWICSSEAVFWTRKQERVLIKSEKVLLKAEQAWKMILKITCHAHNYFFSCSSCQDLKEKWKISLFKYVLHRQYNPSHSPRQGISDIKTEYFKYLIVLYYTKWAFIANIYFHYKVYRGIILLK